MQFSSIWPIDRTLSGATTPCQSGPGRNGNEGVLRIPQSSSITGTSLSDCSVSYLGHFLEKSHPSAEVQSMYSTTPTNWAITESKIMYYQNNMQNKWYICYEEKLFYYPYNGFLSPFLNIYTQMCVCIYIYIYNDGHLINKMNFARWLGNRKHCLQLHLFQRNQ